MRKTGKYEQRGSIQYFIPNPLPPTNPPFAMTSEMTHLYGEAMHYLGKLEGMIGKQPLDIQRFINAYVTKDALLSSAIEGIHTTMLDVFTQPLLGQVANKSTQLVLNYTHALQETLALLKQKNLPISSRVLLHAHKILMQLSAEGDPGNFRKQLVRVGSLIPTPPQHIPQLMTDLERYINEDDSLPPLIKAGLVHVQFESIHPFLDGNGRIGRMLIVLMLVDSGLLTAPVLYPSYFFKKHQQEYYKKLNKVETHGDFEGWILFYLQAIRDSCIDACLRLDEIDALEKNIRMRIVSGTEQLNKTEHKQPSKKYDTQLRAVSIIFAAPVMNVKTLSDSLGVSHNTTMAIIRRFIELGILVETTATKRNRLFKFADYLDLLEKEY